jgi:hypothetical protein
VHSQVFPERGVEGLFIATRIAARITALSKAGGRNAASSLNLGSMPLRGFCAARGIEPGDYGRSDRPRQGAHRSYSIGRRAGRRADTLDRVSPKVHVLTVRPSVPEDERDASGRPLYDAEGSPNAASEADQKAVRTVPNTRDSTPGASFPDKRSVPTTPLHAQSPQQDTPDMKGSRANRGPAIDGFGAP